MGTPDRLPDPDPRPVAEQSRLYVVDGGHDPRRARKLSGFSRLPEAIWAPLAAAALTLLAGTLALLVGQPLLFASLGPTAFLQAHEADSESSTLFSTLAGHGVGIVVGYLAVWAFALEPPSALFSLHHLTPARMWASVIAVGLTMLLQLMMDAYHPPAAATTLLITLGAFALTRDDVLSLVGGILAVAFAGAGLRLVRLRAPAQDPRAPSNDARAPAPR